jgi:hypothetical protein
MDELYGLEIAEQIEAGIITEEEYIQLVEEIGEPQADKYVIPLTERYVHPSPHEMEEIRNNKKRRKDRVGQ